MSQLHPSDGELYSEPIKWDIVKVRLPARPDAPGILRGMTETPWAEVLDCADGVLTARIDNHVIAEAHGYKVNDRVQFRLEADETGCKWWTAHPKPKNGRKALP